MLKKIETCDRFEYDEKDNEDISYCYSIKVRHYIAEIFISDYGQCYLMKYKNLKTGETDEVGLGTYNFNYIEEVLSCLDPKGLAVTLDGIDSWNQRMAVRESRGLESIDYDDYDTYDIEGFYEEQGKN